MGRIYKSPCSNYKISTIDLLFSAILTFAVFFNYTFHVWNKYEDMVNSICGWAIRLVRRSIQYTGGWIPYLRLCGSGGLPASIGHLSSPLGALPGNIFVSCIGAGPHGLLLAFPCV